jgi:four helix bundle protein
MKVFDHERLEVYQSALRFAVLAREIIKELPAGFADLADQLGRASTSIVLNTAEGAGEFSKKEKARFYRFAKRSATECAGVLDVFRVLKLVEDARLLAGRELLLRIVGMHVRLVRNLHESGTGRGTGTGETEE